MKLKDFLTLKVGSGVLVSGTRYNPLINYDWSTTTASGLRYLKDVGSTPTYNASMYFGRGAYLNGVDQTITVPINTTIQTALKRVNGIVTINETSQTLTDYVISGLGVHKDYYLFTRLLTTAEKDSYTNTPELFYAMAQSDATCVLNMPMCETDGYARNMKSYSLGSELASNDYTKYSSYYGAVISSYNNKIKVANTTLPYGQARYTLSTAIGNTYVLKVFFELGTSYSGKVAIGTDGNEVIKNVQSSGEYSLVYTATSTSSYIVFEASQTSSNYILVSSITCTQQSGIHAITNYTSSVRDNAWRLPYGLQTSGFKRDSNGLILSKSNFLEADGVGYVDTGYNITPLEEKTIEIITTELTGVLSDYSYIIGNRTNQAALYTRFSIGLSNRIGVNCNGYGFTEISFINKVYIAIVINTNGYNVYKDGVAQGFKNTQGGNHSGMLQLSNSSLSQSLNNCHIRLFKVHRKALTQEEITKNYNSYVAKGLLS